MAASAPSSVAKYSKLATNNNLEGISNDVDDGNGDLELSFLTTAKEKTREAGRQQNDDTTLAENDEFKDEDDHSSMFMTLSARSDVQREEVLQLWRLQNLAVPLCYFMVGLVQGLMYPLLNIYPLDLGATEAQQQTVWFLKELPSTFKIVFGLWSDNVPIMGLRRKPYMIFGWGVAMTCMAILVSSCDLTMNMERNDTTNNNSHTTIEDDDDDDDETQGNLMTRTPPDNAPSIPFLSVLIFLWASGVWIADVMGDSLVAEKAKYERPGDRGNLQAICYVLRGLGIAMMYPVSSLVYSTSNRGPAIIVTATGLFPLALFPFMYHLYDRNVLLDARNSSSSRSPIGTSSATKEHLHQLWKTACSPAVWQPMGFVYIYITLFVSNAAWREFLKSVLGFTPNQLNGLLMVAGVLAFVGLVVYKYFLMKTSWRAIFMVGIVVNGIFSFLQLLLVWDAIPFGMSPFLFSMGDDGVRDFLLGTQYLPICVMMVNLVPSGIEGASYALFTTTWNAAGAVSDSLSTVLLSIWDVSKETLLSGDLTGLANLTLLIAGLQMIPIFFVGFIPHSVEDLNRLQRAGDESTGSPTSWLGGAVYLTIVFGSILIAVFVGIMNVLRPGWMGES